MVHHGWPLGGWYCTISFLFSSILPTQLAPSGLPKTSIMLSLATPALSVRNFQVVSAMFAFFFFFCSDDHTMGFPDSSCLFLDLIPFVYLPS